MSGTFLWIIGILNLIVLLDIVRIFREMRGGEYDRERLENRLLERGMMNRFFGRFFRLIDASWQMYPLGVLFGLGFDTATEVGLLALAAGVATDAVPFGAILSPADPVRRRHVADGHARRRVHDRRLRLGVLEPGAQGLLQHHVTGLSVVVALAIGTVELLQVLSARLALSGGFWDWLNGLDFETLGYAVVALFLLMWAASVSIWKLRRIEDRWAAVPAEERRGP